MDGRGFLCVSSGFSSGIQGHEPLHAFVEKKRSPPHRKDTVTQRVKRSPAGIIRLPWKPLEIYLNRHPISRPRAITM